MQQCPLFGRRPLFGVSVNRESTVVYTVGYNIIYLINLNAAFELSKAKKIFIKNLHGYNYY